MKDHDHEFKGRLREMLELQKKAIWYHVGQCVLGVLTAAAVLFIVFTLFFMEG